MHLTVTDLDRSVGFYQDRIGLQLHSRGDSRRRWAPGERTSWCSRRSRRPGRPGATPGSTTSPCSIPSREELASALQRLVVTRTPMQGASDHGVSEALYLPDPDENGIELYADRPRDALARARAREQRGHVHRRRSTSRTSCRRPRAPSRRGMPDPGLTLGHVHLHVGDVPEALRFYRDVIGFEPMAELPGAAFVAAGGYHHHLGLNNWRGQGVPPAPADAVGLRHWTLAARTARTSSRVRASGWTPPACRPRSATRACSCAIPRAPPWCWPPAP